MLIVFHHVQEQSPQFKAIWPTEAGQSGVDLFFVISGFVMVYVTRDRERTPTQFLAMRAIRIIPIYWFYTLCATLLMLGLPQLFRSNELSMRHVILSLLFIPHYTEAAGTSPIVKQGWTLNYEVFFYVLFAIAMAISVRRRVLLAAAVLSLLVAAGFSLQAAEISLGTADFYLKSIILEFAFGMLIAQIYLAGGLRRITPAVGFGLVLIGFISLFLLDPLYSAGTRAAVYGVPAAVIVIGALAIENREKSLSIPILQFAGDASYSIYLVHGFPIAALRSIWKHGPFPLSGLGSFLVFLSVSFVLSVVFGGLSYKAIEKTSLKFLRKRVARYL